MIAALIASCAEAVQLRPNMALQIESDPICNSAGCTQFLHPEKDRGYKINYFVPDFGVDKDIIANKNSLANAEKQLGHKWEFPTGKPKRKEVEYKEDLPLDEDIVATKKNLKSVEKDLGHTWKVTEVFKS